MPGGGFSVYFNMFIVGPVHEIEYKREESNESVLVQPPHAVWLYVCEREFSLIPLVHK